MMWTFNWMDGREESKSSFVVPFLGSSIDLNNEKMT
jgi:hypothetical protein